MIWEEFYKTKFQKAYQEKKELTNQLDHEINAVDITVEEVIKVEKSIKVDDHEVRTVLHQK